MSKKRLAFWLCLCCLLAPMAGDARISRDASGSSVSNQPAPLVINEYLADPPAGPPGDANGDGVTSTSQDEFVELINAGSAPVGVGGFSISDAIQTRFTFPPGTVIPAGEAAVIFGGGSPRGDFGNARANGLVFTSGLSLNNASDSIIIKDSFGAEVARHDYPPPESDTNQSITRSPDINGNFVEHSTAQGGDGRLFSPGTQLNGSAFTVAPSIARIAPDRVPFRSPEFDLSVEGSGFEAESKVFIDSSPVATSFINADGLMATVPESVTGIFGPHVVEVRNQGGNRSNPVTLTVIPPPPLLLSVLPRLVNVGTGNFTLFALGENFDTGSVVIVEETILPTTRIGGGELRALVPSALTATLGQRRVRVRNSDGQQSRDLGFEVVLPGLRVTSLTPAQTVAGGPPLALTIAGANFRDGAVAVLDQTPLPTRVASATVIQADVAAPLLATPGLKGVRVQNSDGTISNEVLFRISPLAPLIHFIDPATVTEGSGDRTITITGERFQPGAVARIDAPSAPRQRLDTIFINDSRLEAVIRAELVGVAGKLTIIIENPDSGISNGAALNVSIKNPLVVNEYLADPADGPEGDANGDGTRSASQDEFVEIINRTPNAVDISGYRLSDAESVRHVFAAGTVVPPFEAAVVFGGGTAKGRFGNAAENNLVFRASTGGLSLNNGSDRVRLEDAEGRLVQEITYGATEGGANQSINRDPDADGATFSLHTLVAGRGVLFSPGTRVTGQAFTIKPAIHSLAPASIRRAALAFTLKVTGASFLSGSQVLFGQTALETDFISATELEARVGAELIMNGGLIDVRVRNPRGEVSASAKFVIADDPPRIAEVTPQKVGTFAEMVEITLRGERFQPNAVVLFADGAIETAFIDASELRARPPARLFTRAASVEVRVLNADGNRSNALTLEVENGPLITRLSRSKVRAGKGAVDISIGGVAFKPGVTLAVNDAPVEARFVSETEFEARIPAELIAAPGRLMLQARNPDGGRSNKVTLRVIE